MLKIYHLHERIVDYEEHIDKILESHLIKEKLEEKIKELEKNIIQTNCNNCPLYFSDEYNKKEIEEFCKYYKPFYDEPSVCENFNTKTTSYFIEEKEINMTKEELLEFIKTLN